MFGIDQLAVHVLTALRKLLNNGLYDLAVPHCKYSFDILPQKHLGLLFLHDPYVMFVQYCSNPRSSPPAPQKRLTAVNSLIGNSPLKLYCCYTHSQSNNNFIIADCPVIDYRANKNLIEKTFLYLSFNDEPYHGRLLKNRSHCGDIKKQ